MTEEKFEYTELPSAALEKFEKEKLAEFKKLVLGEILKLF
jgi:hypothetical protein